MIKIAAIEPLSPAHKAGLVAGDQILRMNGEEVRDKLDFEFLRAESALKLDLLHQGIPRSLYIERDYGEGWGIEPEIMKIHLCKNKCVFCFVHQTPKGMRKSLYVKDEDYRYSFLDGHFTTLSNMKEKDWERVVEQRLSPLYVSVHATDPKLRAMLLGNERLEPILERLHWLSEQKIDYHTQLVVCPNYNDKEHLRRSLADLTQLDEHMLSVSVVPVGLTNHRDHLPLIRSFTREDACITLDICQEFTHSDEAKGIENRVFPSDELFVLSGRDLPPPSFYGDYAQYENGVGTLTSFWDDFSKALPGLSKGKGLNCQPVTLLTAPLAQDLQEKVMTQLAQKTGLQYEVLVCENQTFGHSVTVTGLLGGKDFYRTLNEKSSHQGLVLIPPNSLNNQGLFIDDWTVAQLAEATGRPVVVPETFEEYFRDN